jgi:hypothetical protein
MERSNRLIGCVVPQPPVFAVFVNGWDLQLYTRYGEDRHAYPDHQAFVVASDGPTNVEHIAGYLGLSHDEVPKPSEWEDDLAAIRRKRAART